MYAAYLGLKGGRGEGGGADIQTTVQKPTENCLNHKTIIIWEILKI